MKWWKNAVAYQIYPKSFMDSNNDGKGDLRGITSKLDYLKDLGIDLIWLSPVYQSPMKDNGYDVSDYYCIDETYGTMDDFDELLEEAHKRGIRLVMDLVINHSSDQHEWFKQARESRESKYRDYYWWRDPKDGREPNNWAGYFHETVWTYDDKTGQYYLGLFSPYQPDLNWENPDLREDLYRMINWWLEKGLDGFRLDAINLISKVPGLPNNEDDGMDSEFIFSHKYFVDGPRVHEFFHEMHEKTFKPYNACSIGECGFVNTERALGFTVPEREELDMVFTFEHTDYYNQTGRDVSKLKEIISKWQLDLHNKGWSGICFSNHDQPRIVSCFGDAKQYRVESAKLFAMLLLTIEGTPFIYQGEELGLPNTEYDTIEDYDDISAKKLYRVRKREGLDELSIMEEVRLKGRDRSRSPMHWDSSEFLGFSEKCAWIKPNLRDRNINVADSLSADDSVLNFYKRMIRLRKEHQTLNTGVYELLETDSEIFAFTKSSPEECFMIILNSSETERRFDGKKITADAELVIGNYNDRHEINGNCLTLRPYEAILLKLR
ncbi:MAG TPA: alpha-glucosidase [Thermotogota bacterium]|nr:alpha-glucosidase [Thermotogota bacterium]